MTPYAFVLLYGGSCKEMVQLKPIEFMSSLGYRTIPSGLKPKSLGFGYNQL